MKHFTAALRLFSVCECFRPEVKPFFTLATGVNVLLTCFHLWPQSTDLALKQFTVKMLPTVKCRNIKPRLLFCLKDRT